MGGTRGRAGGATLQPGPARGGCDIKETLRQRRAGACAAAKGGLGSAPGEGAQIWRGRRTPRSGGRVPAGGSRCESPLREPASYVKGTPPPLSCTGSLYLPRVYMPKHN